jgi:hypothetical protein
MPSMIADKLRSKYSISTHHLDRLTALLEYELSLKVEESRKEIWKDLVSRIDPFVGELLLSETHTGIEVGDEKDA